MDNQNNEVTATFISHYGAMLTKKKLGNRCTLRPVPRILSSSCGTCAVVSGGSAEELEASAGEYLEAVYVLSEEGYRKIYEHGSTDKLG